MEERLTAKTLAITVLEMLGVALLVFALAWALVKASGG